MFSKNKQDPEKDDINSSNIIGKETVLEGTINTVGNTRIEGKVIGTITTKTKLVLGSTAYVDGNIVAQNCEIGGHVSGNMQILGLLILRSTAVVEGDITTGKLIFEEGARFNGKCQMAYNKSAGGAQSNQPPLAQTTPVDKKSS